MVGQYANMPNNNYEAEENTKGGFERLFVPRGTYKSDDFGKFVGNKWHFITALLEKVNAEYPDLAQVRAAKRVLEEDRAYLDNNIAPTMFGLSVTGPPVKTDALVKELEIYMDEKERGMVARKQNRHPKKQRRKNKERWQQKPKRPSSRASSSGGYDSGHDSGYESSRSVATISDNGSQGSTSGGFWTQMKDNGFIKLEDNGWTSGSEDADRRSSVDRWGSVEFSRNKGSRRNSIQSDQSDRHYSTEDGNMSPMSQAVDTSPDSDLDELDLGYPALPMTQMATIAASGDLADDPYNAPGCTWYKDPADKDAFNEQGRDDQLGADDGYTNQIDDHSCDADTEAEESTDNTDSTDNSPQMAAQDVLPTVQTQQEVPQWDTTATAATTTPYGVQQPFTQYHLDRQSATVGYFRFPNGDGTWGPWTLIEHGVPVDDGYGNKYYHQHGYFESCPSVPSGYKPTGEYYEDTHPELFSGFGFPEQLQSTSGQYYPEPEQHQSTSGQYYPEKRRSTNGQYYTKEKFLSHFGYEEGEYKWRQAGFQSSS